MYSIFTNIKRILIVLLFFIHSCFASPLEVENKRLTYIKLYTELLESGNDLERLSYTDFIDFLISNHREIFIELESNPSFIDIYFEVVKKIDLIHKKTFYRIKNKIMEGTDKIVFSTRNDKALCLFVKSPEKRKNFKKEVGFLGSLDHPNIIKMYESNEELLFIIQDLAEYDLCEYLNMIAESYDQGTRETYDQRKFLEILRGIVSGLEYLKENNIVHRDLKLENILLFRDGDGVCIPKIIDFSFALRLPEDVSKVKCDRLSGSFYFVSPQCFYEWSLKKHYFASYEDDIYSLGILAYSLFHLKSVGNFFYLLWKKSNEYTSYADFYLRQVLRGVRPPICSEELKNLIGMCWGSSRATPREIINEIDRILEL